jgi:hypothetical protein
LRFHHWINCLQFLGGLFFCHLYSGYFIYVYINYMHLFVLLKWHCLLHKFTSPLLFSFFLLYLKWWQMFLFSFESQLPTLSFFHISLKSSCKSCASLSPTTFCLYEQVDKLKVLSESLASSTSKAEKRILDHR